MISGHHRVTKHWTIVYLQLWKTLPAPTSLMCTSVNQRVWKVKSWVAVIYARHQQRIKCVCITEKIFGSAKRVRLNGFKNIMKYLMKLESLKNYS